MSKKQELARARNFFLFRLTGGMPHIHEKYLTEEESILVSQLKAIREKLIEEFDIGSRELGLKIPEHKCWIPSCRNKVKYIVESHEKESIKMCKKHAEKFGNEFENSLEYLDKSLKISKL